MSKEKKELSPEEQIAALQAELAAKDEIIAGQNETLESLGDEKKHKAPIITYKKEKYKVLSNKCKVKVGDALKEVVLTEDGKKVAEDADVAAILKIEGQNILEPLTAKS